MKKSDRFFSQIPKPILHSGLYDAHKILWAEYFLYADRKTLFVDKKRTRYRASIKCHPPYQSEIAKELRWSYGQVKKIYGELKTLGYLHSTRKKRYTVWIRIYQKNKFLYEGQLYVHRVGKLYSYRVAPGHSKD